MFQGRERNALQNQPLGSFILEGIQAAPRMEPKIEVAFRIDEDGILSVRARDSKSGAQQGIRVEDSLGLQKVTPEDEEVVAAIADKVFDDGEIPTGIDLVEED